MTKQSRQTRQKETLYEQINQISSFFTAEDLLNKVKKKDKHIGIATIYRFLKTSLEKDKIHSYLCGKRTIYSREKRSHCHFTCDKCGQTTHFNAKNLTFLNKVIPGEMCHIQINVGGICNKCKNQ